jgi:NADH-quinone oxidoreductase subunit A
MSDRDLVAYSYICVFACGGVIAALVPFLISHLLRPRARISARTRDTYECGNLPFGQSWDFRHGIAFYLYALIFLAFEVDILYLYPVAAAFGTVAPLRGILLFAGFIGMLALGLVYAWRKGVFMWSRERKIY